MPHKHVAVIDVDADDGTIIMIVVCRGPNEVYASKDQKHVGFVRGGQFIPSKDCPALSERESTMVVRASFALMAALDNLHG